MSLPYRYATVISRGVIDTSSRGVHNGTFWVGGLHFVPPPLPRGWLGGYVRPCAPTPCTAPGNKRNYFPLEVMPARLYRLFSLVENGVSFYFRFISG